MVHGISVVRASDILFGQGHGGPGVSSTSTASGGRYSISKSAGRKDTLRPLAVKWFRAKHQKPDNAASRSDPMSLQGPPIVIPCITGRPGDFLTGGLPKKAY
jgi:hypothetical protein